MVGSPRWTLGGCCTAVVVSLGILQYIEGLHIISQQILLPL